MILGRYLLTSRGLDLKLSDNILIGGAGPYEGCSSPMVDLSNYEFKSLTDKIVKPEGPFINSYVDECLKYEITIRSTRRMRTIFNDKYKKADLKKSITEQCQHLTPSERENI